MKTLTKLFPIATGTIIVAILLMASFANAQDQIEFLGLYSEGEGGASWDADGSGPEPYGNGHGGTYYYLASRDYVDAGSTAGAHILDAFSGFPTFEQALQDNGFTAGQITIKFGLAGMGEDLEGIDWFTLGAIDYANFYPVHCTVELDGNPLLEAIGDYTVYSVGAGLRKFQSGYLKVSNTANASPANVLNMANAFMVDIGSEELQLNMEVVSAANLSGNGRSGGYFDVLGTFTKGLPSLPFMGLNANHEGFAGWDADGTGPEPAGDGHDTQLYYVASLDYEDIDPDQGACLGHLLEGSTGFLNTLLQLQYRGFEIGELKLKLGLTSLGPDVIGEDYGTGWCNYYNNSVTVELDGEPILNVLMDTNKMVSMPSYYRSVGSFGKVYDISENASPGAQFVAQSFLKDLGPHFLKIDTDEVHSVGLFNGNGRDGGMYEITEGTIVGVHEQATFIPEGTVSGTWAAEDSPVYVDGHLTIEDGQTLTIEPGVKVAVRGSYVIDVQGCIKAEGTAEENIYFSSSNPNLWWDGFAYDGAFIADTDTSVFDHCIFQYGYAQGTILKHNSGGIFLIDNYDNLFISNSTFRHNKADIGGTYPPSGGAFAFENSDITIQKCIFYDNVAEYGGAILCYANSDPIISNCLFYDNYAENGGAISFYNHGSGILINNTLAENGAKWGGALFFYFASNPEIINNVIWGNEASVSGNQVYSSASASAPGFYYCDIQDGHAGFGGTTIHGDYLFNMEDDPEFETDPELPPYLISTTSPCINQGTPDTSAWYYPQYLPETCLCGNPRTCNGQIEMGSYELLISNTDEITMANDKLQIFPNPFIENLTIDFELQNTAFVEIEIYNVMGAKVGIVNNKTLPAGKHQLSWNSANFPKGSPREAGIYFCRIKVGDEVFTRKIVKQ